MHKLLRDQRQHLAVLILFVLLTLIISYPLPLRLNQLLIGKDIDDFINPWVDWWTHHVLTTQGEYLYYTDYLFYPNGVSLVFHSFSHVNTAVSLALQPLIGQPAAYNVSMLLAYLISAFGMYLLIEHLTGSKVAGVLSGVAFAFNPYHVFESHHPVLMATQWIPLSLLFLIRWLREHRKWHLLLAALFFLLNALTSWHLMIFVSLWLVVFAIYHLIFERGQAFWKRVWRWGAFGLLAGLLVLPFLFPLLREQFVVSQPYMEASVEDGRPMDLWNVILPPWVEQVKRSGYLGLVAMFLVVVGVWKGGKEARMWAVSAAIFFLIAIGPKPKFRGEVIEAVTLPWSAIFIPLLRDPLRFHMLVMFGLAGAAGYGWVVIRRHLKCRWQGWYVLCAFGTLLLLVLDYSHWPFPYVEPVVSPFYERLAREPGDFAIAPLPSTRQTSKYYMYYQTLHGKKTVGGHVSRTSREATAFMEGHDLIWSVCTSGSIDSGITDISRQFDRLSEVGIRYVVFHKDRVSDGTAEQWRTYLPLTPAYEDEYLAAYYTDLQLGRDYSFAYELAPTLGILRTQVTPKDVFQGTFLGLEIVWGTAEPPGRDLSARIEFVDQAGDMDQVETLALYPTWPSAEWPADTIVIGRYRIRVDAHLPADEYIVRVSLVDALSGELVGGHAALGTLTVQPVTRVYEAPIPDIGVHGCFGDRVCLLGYDVDFRDGELDVALYWQATRLMEQDYVISTRLLDPGSGTRVWQRDAAPRDWRYPTTWWDIGEVVSDTLTCDLSSVSAGQYQLEVVVYEPESGAVLAPSNVGSFTESGGGGLLLGKIDVP